MTKSVSQRLRMSIRRHNKHKMTGKIARVMTRAVKKKRKTHAKVYDKTIKKLTKSESRSSIKITCLLKQCKSSWMKN